MEAAKHIPKHLSEPRKLHKTLLRVNLVHVGMDAYHLEITLDV